MIIPASLPVPDKREFWKTLDSTKLQCYARCARKYFFEYVLGWASSNINNHLIFGQGWHEALEYLYRGNFKPEGVPAAYEKFLECYRRELPEESDSMFKGKNPQVVYQALLEYLIEHVADTYSFKVLGSEVGGLVPISEHRALALKMDLVVEDSKGIMVLEHKTGSQAGRTWEMQWQTSLQIGTYLHGLSCSYVDSPEKARIVINGTFFYAKERRFVRKVERRAGWAMLDWLDTVHGLWDRIEDDFQKLALCSDSAYNMNAFHKNPVGCTDYSGCPFFDVCTTCSNPLRFVEPVNGADGSIPAISGFKYRWWNPMENLKIDVKTKEEICA